MVKSGTGLDPDVIWACIVDGDQFANDHSSAGRRMAARGRVGITYKHLELYIPYGRRHQWTFPNESKHKAAKVLEG